MKLTLERAALLKALAALVRIVERRNTIPILSHVLIRADGDGLTLTGTDLDLMATTRAAAAVAESGAIALPAATLHDIVRKLPDGAQLALETIDAGRLGLRAGRARFTLQTLPAGGFPDFGTGDLPHCFTLPGPALAGLLARCEFAISTEETRYYLNGVYLHTTLDARERVVLRAVATDGHRLARVDYAVQPGDGQPDFPGVIVPRKTVAEIKRLAEAAGAGTVAIELSAQKMRVTVGDTVLASKLIDGTFPDYVRVIPTAHPHALTADTAAFAAALDRVSTVAIERGRAVRLALGEGGITLTVNNPDAGEAVEEVAAEFDAAPLTIGFNARYLADVLAQCPDTVRVSLNSPGCPTLFQPHAGADALYVLMPMRV